jgi:uncharacterized protein (UPF0332 family)
VRFEGKHFVRHAFSAIQVEANLENAKKDLAIAEQIPLPEVRFNFAYSALIKSGIALLSSYSVRARSTSGHHLKIIEKLSEILGDQSIEYIGNAMRAKRNADFYGGGMVVTETEAAEYLQFAEAVLQKVTCLIQRRAPYSTTS